MSATVAVRNTMLDAGFPASVTVSIHSGNPGESGANELSGGSPAYARMPATFLAASGGQKAISETSITFDIPSGSTVQYVGVWDGSTFLASGKLQTTVNYSQAQGEFVLSSMTWTLV